MAGDRCRDRLQLQRDVGERRRHDDQRRHDRHVLALAVAGAEEVGDRGDALRLGHADDAPQDRVAEREHEDRADIDRQEVEPGRARRRRPSRRRSRTCNRRRAPARRGRAAPSAARAARRGGRPTRRRRKARRCRRSRLGPRPSRRPPVSPAVSSGADCSAAARAAQHRPESRHFSLRRPGERVPALPICRRSRGARREAQHAQGVPRIRPEGQRARSCRRHHHRRRLHGDRLLARRRHHHAADRPRSPAAWTSRSSSSL